MVSIWSIQNRIRRNGREAIVIKPKVVLEEKSWTWRIEFFDVFAQADMEILEKGYYLVYYRINDMYGTPESIQLIKEFQNILLKKFILNVKTILFGFVEVVCSPPIMQQHFQKRWLQFIWMRQFFILRVVQL